MTRWKSSSSGKRMIQIEVKGKSKIKVNSKKGKMPITIDFGDGSTQSPDSNDEERTKKGKYKKVSYAKPRYEFVRRKINKVNHKKKLRRPRLRKRKCVHIDYNEETDNDSGEDEVEEEQDDGEQDEVEDNVQEDEAEDNVQEDEVEENVEEDEVEVNVDNVQTDNEVEDLGENDLEEDKDEGCINEEEEVELNVDLQDDEDEGSHYVEKDLNANKRKGRKKFQEKRLYIRASKKNFYSFMNNLSSKQKADIKQLGFGSLIKFSIMNVPTRLAYYVLEKFSSEDSVLEVNGNLVLVNKERVHDVFGIPIGGKKIPYCPQILYAHEARKPQNFQFPLFKNWDLESLKEIEKEISRNGDFEKVTEEIKMVIRRKIRDRMHMRETLNKELVKLFHNGLRIRPDDDEILHLKQIFEENITMEEFYNFLPEDEFGEEEFFGTKKGLRETVNEKGECSNPRQKDVTGLDENFEGEIDNIAIQKQDKLQKKTVKLTSKEDQELAGKTTRIEGVRECLKQKNQNSLKDIQHKQEKQDNKEGCQSKDVEYTFDKVGDEQHSMERKTNRIEADRESLKEKYHNSPEAIEHKQGNQDDKQSSQSKAVESIFQKVGDEGHGIGGKSTRNQLDCDGLMDKTQNAAESDERNLDKNKVDRIEADRKIGEKSIESSVHNVGDADHKIGEKSTTAGLDQNDLMDKIQNPAEANQGNQDKMKVDQQRKIDQILNKLNSKRTILEVNDSEIKKKSGVHKKKKVDPFLPSFDLGFDSPDSIEDGEIHGQRDLDETLKVKDLKSLPDTEKVSQNISQMPFLKVSNSEVSKKGCDINENKENVPNPFPMVKRNKFTTNHLTSPYYMREVKVNEILSSVEDRVSSAIFSARCDPSDPIFKMDQLKAPRVVFETMRPEHMIIAQVIDVWASILNYEESKRDMKGTVRLFCHTNIISPDMIQFDSSADKQMQDEIVFSNRIADILKQYGLKSLKDVDLRELFGTYMAIEEAVVTNFVQSKPVIVRMNWRTKRNFNDSGIFAMRHMGVYKGNGLYNFNSGFVNESVIKGNVRLQQNQLYDLRKKYVTKMLTSDLNELHNNVTTEVEDYFKIPEFMRRILENKSSAEIDERVKQTMEIVITR
uniref:uncharacterized protein LOC122601262 n=1 Tax=Erigeron canadensis TaxID=72917 RepID=UPI001CB926D3|nr:uncharacterized protein LOC122601262 [Erigeron canadensis]